VSPWPLAAVAVALLALGLLPGVAKLPTMLGGGVLAVVAWWLARASGPGFERSGGEAGGRGEQGQDGGDLVLELGLGLLDLVEEPDSLMPLLPEVRGRVGRAVGFTVPAITVRDALDLGATEYALVFRAGTLSRGTVRPGRILAVPPRAGATPDVGQPGQLADGRTGVWVEPDEATALAAEGYALMSAQEALAENLSIILRRRAAQILDLESAAAMIQRLRADHGELIEEAEAAGMSVGLFRRVCTNLLWASVPLHDPVSIIEGITEALPEERDPERLAVAVRRRLAGMLSDHLAEGGRVRALALSPTLEEELAEAALREGDRTVAALPPARAAAWVDLLDQAGREHGWGRTLAVLTGPRSLLPLQWLCRQTQSELIALQATDLSPTVQVEHVARLEPEQLG
ncbi:MAG: FHIPEP family type III secretion protein, partial [Armatimonadota bacterium]